MTAMQAKMNSILFHQLPRLGFSSLLEIGKGRVGRGMKASGEGLLEIMGLLASFAWIDVTWSDSSKTNRLPSVTPLLF